MPAAQAKLFCDELICIQPSEDAYNRFSTKVSEILIDRAPVLEKAAIDEFYIDLTEIAQSINCFSWATELQQKITSETGLPVLFGLAPNKMLAKIATGLGGVNGRNEITVKQIPEILDQLPISKIPDLADKTVQILAAKGIRKAGVLRQLPKAMLNSLLGKPGTELIDKANGLDDSKVIPYQIPETITAEETFVSNCVNTTQLKAIATCVAQKMCHELRTQKKLTGCITLKICYSDFSIGTKQAHISYTSAEDKIIKQVIALYKSIYITNKPVKLIGIRAGELIVNNYQQLSLFESPDKIPNLYNNLDKSKDKAGAILPNKSLGFNSKFMVFAPSLYRSRVTPNCTN